MMSQEASTALRSSKFETCIDKEKCFVVSFILELCIILHCRMDDILDNSILRRGIPTAHSIFGVLSTLNAANYVIMKGLKKVECLNHPEAMATCTKHLLDAYWGQGMEIYWRDNYICPSEEEYQEMVLRSKNMTTKPSMNM
jgi:geranylgeranyl diphosphate synthase type 3